MVNAVVTELQSNLETILANKGLNAYLDEGKFLIKQTYDNDTDAFMEGLMADPPQSDWYTRKPLIVGGPEEPGARLMAWGPDCELCPHEHWNGPCIEIVLKGKLEFTYWDADHLQGDEYDLTPREPTIAEAGQVAVVDWRDTQIHSVRTIEAEQFDNGEYALSMHFYPVDPDYTFCYREQPNGLYLRAESEVCRGV